MLPFLNNIFVYPVDDFVINLNLRIPLTRLPIKNFTSLLIGTWDNIHGDVFLLYCNNLTLIDKKVNMCRLAHVVMVLHM